MYNASDFADFELGKTEEFEDSIASPSNDLKITDGSINRINMSTDYTNFLITIQYERQDGGIYFDGLLGTNVTIKLSGTPMFRGNSDTNFIPDLNDPNLQYPSPLICFINDALIV
ncbi:MAG: hypothetical protein LBU40_02340 [Methanobrevibacter sp.]|jgi:hypothetical protein|nr:hypothetical protein [Methanobrevibacter sp.]